MAVKTASATIVNIVPTAAVDSSKKLSGMSLFFFVKIKNLFNLVRLSNAKATKIS